MKKLIIVFLLLGILGCKEDKFIIKKIGNDDISIKWYYNSYISNLSAEYIEVEKDGEIKKIYEAKNTITDISIDGDKIVIKLYKPSNGLILTKKAESKIFDYKIVIDTTATLQEYKKIPDAVKE